MTILADAEARRRIASEFGTTFFVEAAAGTGKTTELVGRIVGLVRSGAGALSQIVAVTFTEKAAGEMKLRLRGKIEEARHSAQGEERERLDRALRELELARIGTIHAFCTDVLHERPVEAGIDPLFEVSSEEETEGLADQAFDGWFQRILSDPPEGVRRVLRRRNRRASPREQLRAGLDALCKHRDFPAPWRRDQFDRNSRIDALIDALRQLGALAASSSWANDRLAMNLSEMTRFVQEVTRLEPVSGRDYDGLEAELRAFARRRSWSWKGAHRTTFGALARDEVLGRRDQLKADLDAFIAASDADLAPLLQETLKPAIADYENLKAKLGRLDFLDLLLKTRDLVRDNAAVRRDLQQRFSHFFVDEFQDTDPLQAEILILLSADDPAQSDWRTVRPVPGKLFLVGDPKQSIYRFRRADVAIYEDVKQRLLAAGAELIHLNTSFRAPLSLQALVNGAFAPAMNAEGGQAGYVPLERARPEIEGRPTVVALPVPAPYGDYGSIVNWRIDESFPHAVGAFVEWLIDASGWMVEEEKKRVPVKPRHIAILFRRFRSFGADITRPYVRALESRRIPHVLVGGRSFHDREEVIALRNALTAIEWPEDELKVFATLRGPFFALSDEALLAFRQQVDTGGTVRTQRLNPSRRIDREALNPAAMEVADALELLRRLHFGRNHRPIAETITMLLEGARALPGIAFWRNGEQALANCQRVVDLARNFERGASSFRVFVERMEADAERGDANEAPIVEEGTEGVRIMTVHKAKGLEFPVVILADPTCNETSSTPSRHVDPQRRLWLEPLCGSAPIELLEAADEELRRDRAEAIRLAYVAATRARDLLVAPVCGDEPIGGWLQVLDPMLYPAEDSRRKSGPAPGCPEFGEDTVLDRGPKGQAPPAGSVRPGLYCPVANGPAVVWWDPAVLPPEPEQHAPLRHQRVLELDADGAAAASEENYRLWKIAREELLARASQPALKVQTVTELARRENENAEGGETSPPVRVETIARRGPDRPGGRRFGALVHAMLASMDFADRDGLEQIAATSGRLIGATDEEIEAAIIAVRAALDHPVLRKAAAQGADGLRRETPVLMRLEDGSLAEGVIDLTFREEGREFTGWVVVDFKTDHEFASSADRYVTQVRLYAEAIGKVMNSPAQGVLLVV
ncbi:MAG: UvrD-helicase domain-containing protein [Bradyrhizobiaceae bacterium]|nr:UvrD-helicase domain-containing protein [Bradyrhizobiaceae bacterium]